jgi:hypothetical protein
LDAWRIISCKGYLSHAGEGREYEQREEWFLPSNKDFEDLRIPGTVRLFEPSSGWFAAKPFEGDVG